MAEDMALRVLRPCAAEMRADPAEDRRREGLAVGVDRQTAQEPEPDPLKKRPLERGYPPGETAKREVPGRDLADIPPKRLEMPRRGLEVGDVVVRQPDQPPIFVAGHLGSGPRGRAIEADRQIIQRIHDV